MATVFKVGDKVRIINVTFDYERGIWVVSKHDTSRLGANVYLKSVDGYYPLYPYRPDNLKLVEPTEETDTDRRIRELEERVIVLERKLGMRL